jgi:CheY-like chemotaxis protein
MEQSIEFVWQDEEDITLPQLERLDIARVLVAEDDAALRSVVVSRLLDDGYAVFEAESGTDISTQLEHMKSDAFADGGLDLLLLDHRMPGRTGLQVLARLRANSCQIPVILMTAFPDPSLRAEARRLGVPVLAKPFSLTQLSDVAAALLLSRGAANGGTTHEDPR